MIPSSLPTFNLAVVLLALGLATTPCSSPAAQAPRSAKQLKALATHTITGQVVKVVKKKGISEHEKGWYDFSYLITILVEKAQGRGLAPGAQIVVKAWRPAPALIPRPPGLQGHDTIPSRGDTVEVFLKRTGNVYRVLHPNGLTIVKKGPDKKVKARSEKRNG